MNKLAFLMILSVAVMLFSACSQQPTVDFNADTAIPLSLVEDLQFSDTSERDIDDCVAQLLDIAEPTEVTEDDVVPANFVLYIDLDQVYLSWEDFALRPLCNKLNWGIFRTTGNVEIPVVAEVWSIDEEA